MLAAAGAARLPDGDYFVKTDETVCAPLFTKNRSRNKMFGGIEQLDLPHKLLICRTIITILKVKKKEKER